MDNAFHNISSIRFVEAGDDALVKFLGFVWSAGIPEQVGGGFPGLQNFPILPGMFFGDAGVQLHSHIELALFGADVAETAKRFGTPVVLVGVFTEQALVAGRGFSEQPIALGAGSKGRWKMIFVGGKLEERLGGLGVSWIWCGGATGQQNGYSEANEESRKRCEVISWH